MNKKNPIKKLSLQWRLTLIITLLTTVTCVLMYFFISRSAVTGIEDLGGDVALAEVAQGGRDGVEGAQLVGGLVPGVQEVRAVHTLEVKALEHVDVLLDLAHICILS